MAEMIRGLLFDKDGTLFDFQKTWGVWARGFILEMTGGDLDRARDLAQRLDFDFDKATFAKESAVIAGSPDDVADVVSGMVPGADRAAFVARFNASAAQARAIAPVALEPLLGGFRAQGIRLGVATNDSEEAAVAHLDQAGVTGLFDLILGYDSGHGAKPEPGMQRAFCAAFDLSPSAVLMVGDSAHDLESGRAAGMGTVAVLTGVAEAEDLAPLADVVLPDIGHLPGYISGLG